MYYVSAYVMENCSKKCNYLKQKNPSVPEVIWLIHALLYSTEIEKMIGTECTYENIK